MSPSLREGTGFALLAAALSLACAAWAAAAEDTPLEARVDALFAEWDKPDSPGCALGIIRDGKLIYARGYGMANLEHEIPNSPQTVFRIGSTSKQFTAACVVLLAAEGKLRLDDPIRKYISEMPAYADRITVRQLMHHTSGIRDYLTLATMAGARDDDWYADEDVVAMIARQQELNFPPGAEHLYSNSGYFLLSQIVKRVTGASMREYARQRIFEPLGMTHTHFHDDHTMIVKRRAAGYAPREDGGFAISMTTLDMIGDGGVLTTVDDLLHWDRNFYEPRIGGDDFPTAMLARGALNDGKTLDYASGLVHASHNGLKTVQHGGGFVGFRAQMIRFPEQRFTVIVLCNLATMNPTGLAQQVADVYLADVMARSGAGAASPLGVAAPKPSQPAVVELSREARKRVTGFYFNEQDSVARRVRLRDDGKLVYCRGDGKDNALVPLADGSFLMEDVPVRIIVTFEPAEPARPKIMRVAVEGDEPIVMRAFTPAETTAASLTKYVGRYYSPELDVEYTMSVRDSTPVVSYKRGQPLDLQPLMVGRFQVAQMTLEFDREVDGRSPGFKLHANRVRNVQFKRR